MQKQLLMIFVKNPEAGKVKTRLAATVGAEQALHIYKKLLDHTHQISSKLNITKAVFYSDFINNDDIWENSEYLKFKQEGDDLGIKMKNAFKHGFSRSFTSICIIGSDCYQLTEGHIESAFELLQQNQVVIGPSEDGGYYLLGLNNLYSELFNNKKWSTSAIFESTINDLKKLNAKFALLPTLVDIDEEKDLYTMGKDF